MRAFFVITALLAGAVQAGGGVTLSPPAGSSTTPTNSPNIVQATTAALTLYVDPTGSDSNNCTSSGTSACLTIQAAINKIPKMLKHLVTVNIAAGTYTGFIISGFMSDNGVQQAAGGILIDGVLANSTLASGSATGTALGAGQVAGSGSTFGVLCDSGAVWTVNDLRGRIITTASPTNTAFIVSSNTSTCATIVGSWTVPVTAQTTYAIQDAAAIINTAVTLPATPLQASSATSAGAIIIGNTNNYRTNVIALRSLRFTNTTGRGITVGGESAIITQCQLISNATTGINNNSPVGSTADVQVTKVYILGPNNSAFVGLNSNAKAGRLSVNNTFVNTAGALLSLTGGALASLTASEGLNIGSATAAIVAQPGNLNTMSSCRVACATSATAGVFVGSTGSQSGVFTSTVDQLISSDFSTCGIGIKVDGVGASAIVHTLSGTMGTTGMSVVNGGTIKYTSSTTMTGTTQDISIDSGAIVSTLAGIASGDCNRIATTLSGVCKL